MNTLSFNDIPMPPSSNKAYKSFVAGGRIRHVCAPDLVAFKRDFSVYCLANHASFAWARQELAGVPGVELRIDCVFYFKREQLYTLKGKLKKLDVSNRLKALHDCLAEALGVDDSCFMHITAQKRVNDSRLPHCAVSVSLDHFLQSDAQSPIG